MTFPIPFSAVVSRVLTGVVTLAFVGVVSLVCSEDAFSGMLLLRSGKDKEGAEERRLVTGSL